MKRVITALVVLLVGLAKERYYDFRVWCIHRRWWRRETKVWSGVFVRDLRFVVRATAEVLRYHLAARPRFASVEWKAYIDYVRDDYNFRHGHSAIQPAPFVLPWSLGFPTITPDKPVSLADLPVRVWHEWPPLRSTVIH